jgi:hypothetical protein
MNQFVHFCGGGLSVAKKVLILCALAAAFVLPGSASASFIVARDATGIQLGVDAKGVAMVSFTEAGVQKHVMARGAVDAVAPKPGAKQVAFDIDWAGGWGWQKQQLWRSFKSTCGRYDGPPLAYLAAACKAQDGSYWALQRWQRMLPNLGFAAWTKEQAVQELHLSHWTGSNLAKIDVYQGWVYGGRFNGIFGKVTFAGQPVHGFGSSNFGVPKDAFGRNLFLDTLNAKNYGAGWKRENSFLAHNPTGAFCYGFYTFDPTKGGYQHPAGQSGVRGPGVGQRYRLTMIGPGVTPDVMVEVPALHAFDKSSPADVDLEQKSNALLQELDSGCHS